MRRFFKNLKRVPGVARSESTHEGFLDCIDDGVVRGWALNRNDPMEQVAIELIDARGTVICVGIANTFRPDLGAKAIGTGYHGFEIQLPPEALTTAPLAIRARLATTGELLVGSAQIDQRRINRDSRGALDEAAFGEIRGWLRDVGLVRIFVDGQEVGRASAEPQPDASQRLTWRFQIPPGFADGKLHTISAKRLDSERELVGCPRTAFLHRSPRCFGHLDKISNNKLHGWCYSPDFPASRFTVRIDFGDVYTLYARADVPRADLKPHLGANHDCGFSVDLPRGLLPDRLLRVSASVVETEFRLPGEVTFRPEGSHLFTGLDRALVKPFPRAYAEFDNRQAFAFLADLVTQPIWKGAFKLPAVSIIMPTWNRSEIIRRSIQSVVDQYFDRWELLVIDDGSSDDTEAVVKSFEDPRISYHRIEHQGVSVARNFGMKVAKNEIFAYLDSDNEWHPLYLKVLISQMLRNGLDCAYCGSKAIKGDQIYYRGANFDWDALLQGNYIDLNVFVHHRKVYAEHGGFDEQLRRMVDWDLILRYTRAGKTEYVPFIGVRYDDTVRSNRITNSQSLAYEFVILSKHLVPGFGTIKGLSHSKGLTSIVIPVYNDSELTERCVMSVLDNTVGNFEIIIVDNGSSRVFAQRLEALARHSIRVRLVKNFKNLNFSLGNNIGVSNALGDVTVLLNNDTVVSANWLEPLLGRLQDEGVGVVQPRLLYPDGTVQCVGAAFTRYSPFPYHIYKHLPGNHPAVLKSRRHGSLTGACLAVRTIDYIRVGGFDPIYVNGSEDTDLCLRIQRDLTLECWYEAGSVVYHDESKTPGRGRYIFENRKEFARRWRGKTPVTDEAILAADGFFPGAYEADSESARQQGVPIYRPEKILEKKALLSYKKVLIVKPSGVGNMIMSIPMLKALRSCLPEAVIELACYKAEAPLAKRFVDRVHIIGKDSADGRANRSAINELVSRECFDLAIYPPFTNVGFPTEIMAGAIPNHWRHPCVDFTMRHEVLHNFDFARMAGFTEGMPSMALAVSDFKTPLEPGFIAVHIGTSGSYHMQKKRWPIAFWASLIERLTESFEIILVGGENEEKDMLDLLPLLSYETRRQVCSSIGKTSIEETAALLSKASMLISNDSGVMHLAAAVGTPVVAIFGPTSTVKNAPWLSAEKCRVLTSGIFCRPCYTSSAERLNWCADQICLKDVSPNQVVDAVRDLMSQTIGRDRA